MKQKFTIGAFGIITSLVGVYNKPSRSSMVFCFNCKVIGGKLTLNNEADKLEYFDAQKLPPNTVPKQVERIKDFFSAQKKADFEGSTWRSSTKSGT